MMTGSELQSYLDELQGFVDDVRATTKRVFDVAKDEVFLSIVEGSALTGSLGQPEATGELRGSWKLTLNNPLRATIATSVYYAPFVEFGVGIHKLPVRYGDRRGGAHSVRLTKAAWPRILDMAVAQVST